MVVRKYCLLLFVIMSVFLINPLKIDAAICTKSIYAELKEKAADIKMEWKLKFDEKDNHYFEVKASNVDKDLMLIFGGNVYEPIDGNITISIPLEGGKNYQFKFYGAYYHPCVEEYVYTKNLDIPKYNIYSKLDECKKYSDWELCDEWYQGEIEDTEDFYEKLEEYKKKIESGEIVPKSKKEEKKITLIILIVIILISIISFLLYKVITKKRKKGNKAVK